jgi:hypothetical protein
MRNKIIEWAWLAGSSRQDILFQPLIHTNECVWHRKRGEFPRDNQERKGDESIQQAH